MKIKISRTNVSPVRLNVEVKSQGKLGDRPVAFILPGGPGADHTPYLSYACLQGVADLVFHDPRGCGQSNKDNPAGYTLNTYIDDVESIRQALSLDKIIVIGKSYGSMCALGYALRYPDNVEKLVLSAGAPSYRFPDTAKRNLKRKGTPEQIKVCEKLWAGKFSNRDELLTYFQLTQPLYSVRVKQQKSPDLIYKSKQFSYEVLNEGFKNDFWHFDYEAQLPKVTCPTLILAGRHDWINDVSHAEFMAARIPYSRLHVFENASHAMEVDAAEEYFQTIADFITL
ncbi:alpha/beta fold hydrolase [Aquicella lusitana]|uniref:Proline iminopeptidase n=1 Tax=Aquicella lusitana TaxID=254246 RepID=A0A370GQ14_9COXI|nr:alpha/beta hydrolase [Aquicella lusitana]RDI44574.1 proline iminopeptidase [Aquicella lusitana]VVC72484.1 Proline iminopeptidase [Aquicella lusitana]